MAHHSRPSAASDIGSRFSVFFWARLKLTGIFVLILGVIVLGFSLFLYGSFQRNLADASEDAFADATSHQQFVDDTLSGVSNDIMVIDGAVLLLAAGVSYLLAGYVLRPIQRSLRAQREFSENASHELRTPLTVMKNGIEVLLRNPAPTEDLVRATLTSNVEEIDRMSGMAEDLLLLARLQNQAPAAGTETFDAAEAVHAAGAKFAPIAEARGISVAPAAEGPILVRGNKAALARILSNLIRNSIDHTPSGGSVRLTASTEGSRAVVVVADTGSGIDEKDLPRVFERFYKGERSAGTGLGLSIVSELVHRHGGTIDIKSEKGKGTTVALSLPLSA